MFAKSVLLSVHHDSQLYYSHHKLLCHSKGVIIRIFLLNIILICSHFSPRYRKTKFVYADEYHWIFVHKAQNAIHSKSAVNYFNRLWSVFFSSWHILIFCQLITRDLLLYLFAFDICCLKWWHFYVVCVWTISIKWILYTKNTI